MDTDRQPRLNGYILLDKDTVKMASWQDKVLTSSVDKGSILFVKITPKSSKTSFRGLEGDVFCFSVAAVPEDGRANRALIEFLSSCLHFPKSSIAILSGASSRHKKLLFVGVLPDLLCCRLTEAFRLST